MKTITKVQWIELVQQTDDAIILDVRTPQECAEGILDNAQQLNVLNLNSRKSKMNCQHFSKN